MKTLCFSLGLLLLAACCCDAMPTALQFTAPGNCCFNVWTRQLPLNRIVSITKTHSSCTKKAFIVQTIKGRQICYSQTFQWTWTVYNHFNPTQSVAP